MSKFIFRLESLLSIAQSREEEAKKIVGNALNKLKISQDELLSLSYEQTRALRALVEDQKGNISIHSLINNHHYCQTLKDEVEQKQQEVIILEQKVEMARKKLHEAMKQCKIMEKLKEKQYNNFKYEEEKKYQAELDQVVSNLFFTSAGGL